MIWFFPRSREWIEANREKTLNTYISFIFPQTLLPVIIAVIGVFIGRMIPRIDDRSISAVCLFAFVPALLLLQALSQNPFEHEFVFTMFFFFFHTGALFLLAHRAFLFIDPSPRIRHLFLINTMISNMLAYNWILPQLGEKILGLQIVKMLMFYDLVVLSTLGLYLSSGSPSIRVNLFHVFQSPFVYILFIGLWIAALPYDVPYQVLTIIDALDPTSVDLALIVIGVIFGKYIFLIEFNHYRVLLPGLLACLLFRLIVSPAIAMILVYLMKFGNTSLERALILGSGAPTGIFAVVLVSYYGKLNEKRFSVLCLLITSAAFFATFPILKILVNKWFPL